MGRSRRHKESKLEKQVRLFSKRWERVRQRSQRELRPLWKKTQPYGFVVFVFFLVTVASIDWIVQSTQQDSATIVGVNSGFPISAAQQVLKEEPWDYFHPVWVKDGWSLFDTTAKNESISLPSANGDLSEFVSDPEDKIESEFKVSAGMKKRVLFWVEIYAKYSSRVKVVHDRNDPSIVYGYIDLRPLYRVLGPSIAETRGLDVEKKVIAELKRRLAEAIGNRPATTLSPTERAEMRGFLSQVGALSVAETNALVESVRSQSGQRDMFLQALHRSANLLPHIETVFKRKGLPASLARIPFVESSFNVRALSNAGAMGIWQFMPETAKEMIHAEEEKHWSDPIKQTQSAARLLQMYRTLLPDWGTTVTSYNSGVGRVRRLLEKHRLRRVEGLLTLDNSEGLGFAGQNFYAEVLAANIVERYKERIFQRMLGPIDLTHIFKGSAPFPKEICDL